MSEESSPLSPQLTTPESTATYKQKYESSSPYSHCVLSPLCPDEVLQQVRDEIISNLETKFKETDLFKLYQTTDLANVDESQPELAAKLPTLLQLRDALYAPDFRKFISTITGCGELTSRVDMAASAYAEGSHLLCHDDVIGTRAVSFIIYFSAEDWSAKDGGALELFPLDPTTKVDHPLGNDGPSAQGVPLPAPTTRLLPLFNTMAFFRVTPGQSYHAVQEVMRDGSPRLSIQGWYHGPSAPPGGDMASLNQLKVAKLEQQPLVALPYELPAQASPLSDEEVRELSAFMNPTYLKPESIGAMAERFQAESSIQLRHFLTGKAAQRIQITAMGADAQDGLLEDGLPEDDVGVSACWSAQGPAHMQRFLRFEADKAAEEDKGNATQAGLALYNVQEQLFSTPAFGKWLQLVTDGRVRSFAGQVRRFRSGLDYTVAHHGQLEAEERLDVSLTFVNDQSEEAKMVWASGDVGAFECYLAAEKEDNVAAEVYCDDDAEGNDLLSVSAVSNTLSIVLRDPGTMRFVKYVSGAALSSRWDVSGVYTIEYDDDDDEMDDGDD
eukprot:TRINITY_DN4827_c0_g1_i1.p1 TRINITY_DN4827_c0_g1~~TRINITY_DN4827_c0_g1_i1.p1  ORF type:complete len:596 (+),score=157.51 TRINITY_DN4827_c0_g1_i1:124-1788(+)